MDSKGTAWRICGILVRPYVCMYVCIWCFIPFYLVIVCMLYVHSVLFIR